MERPRLRGLATRCNEEIGQGAEYRQATAMVYVGECILYLADTIRECSQKDEIPSTKK